MISGKYRFVIRSLAAASLILATNLAIGADDDALGDDDEALLARLEEIDDLGDLEGLEEFDALMKELGVDMSVPTWDVAGGAEIALGYSDNVELAAFFPKSSAYIRGGADAMIWRYPKKGFEGSGYFDASYTHYIESDVEDASYVMAGGEVKWTPRDTTVYSGALRYLYQNEYIDASSLDQGAIGTTKAEMSSFGFEPTMRWTFAPSWTAVVNLAARYDDYRPPLDDLADYEAGLTLERATDRLGMFSVGYGYLYRDYMDREQAAPGGTPLPGTQLRVTQNTLQVRHVIRGGERVKWKVRTRLASMQSRDNGSGWYDYNRHYGRVALRLEKEGWSFEADAAYRDYKYLQQRAGFGNPPLRKRHEWSASARLERNIFADVAVFGEAEFVSSQSNDPFLEYDQLRGAIGLRWSR